MASVPAIRENDPDRDLISEVAMDIGKDLVAYIERMYPAVYDEMNSGAKLSFRNHIYNDLMSVLKCRTETDYRNWLDARQTHRRRLMNLVRSARSITPPQP
jgi:hypothetical protein